MFTPVQRTVAYSLLNEFKNTGTVAGALPRANTINAGEEIGRSVEQLTLSAAADNGSSDMLLVPGVFRGGAAPGTTFIFKGDATNGELQESTVDADRELQWYTKLTPTEVDRAVVLPSPDGTGITIEFARMDRLNLTGEAFTRALTNEECERLATAGAQEPILLP